MTRVHEDLRFWSWCRGARTVHLSDNSAVEMKPPLPLPTLLLRNCLKVTSALRPAGMFARHRVQLDFELRRRAGWFSLAVSVTHACARILQRQQRARIRALQASLAFMDSDAMLEEAGPAVCPSLCLHTSSAGIGARLGADPHCSPSLTASLHPLHE